MGDGHRILRLGQGDLFDNSKKDRGEVGVVLDISSRIEDEKLEKLYPPVHPTSTVSTFQSTTQQYAFPSRVIPANGVEREGDSKLLSVVDVKRNTIRHISLPDSVTHSKHIDQDAVIDSLRSRRSLHMSGLMGPSNTVASLPSSVLSMVPLSAGDVATLERNGMVRVWQVDPDSLKADLKDWTALFGDSRVVDKPLRLEVESDKKKEAKGPKEGKEDEENQPHVGGNTWRGGTGGSDTAGMGGKGGPYRVDKGHDVHQLSDEEKARVSDDVKKAAQEIAQAELAKRLREIELSSAEDETYKKFLDKVGKEVHQMRLVLEAAEAKEREREWLRHKTQGDLDDGKLIDGVTGDKVRISFCSSFSFVCFDTLDSPAGL